LKEAPVRRSIPLTLTAAIFALSGTLISPAQAAPGPCRPGQGPDLRGRDFTQGSQLPHDLRCADLTEARLDGVELRLKDLTGAILHGASLKRADLTQATLKYADLRGADLTEANLGQLHADHADLRGAILVGTEAGQAEFPYADLTGATLTQARMNQSDLRDATFKDADVSGAEFTQAELDGADFTGTLVEGASFVQADGADLTGSEGNWRGDTSPIRPPADRDQEDEPPSRGDRPPRPPVGLVLVLISAVGLAVTMVVWGVTAQRRSRRNARFTLMWHSAEDGVTRLGEEINRLGYEFHAGGRDDMTADQDWRHAVDAYEAARIAMAVAQREEELHFVTQAVQDGRSALERLRTRSL
jgi:hypothetical protein